MKALREDTFVRKRAGERRRRSSGVIIFSLVFLSSALLVLSRIDHPVVRNARIQFADLAAPALEAVTGWLGPLRNVRETLASLSYSAETIDRLKTENQRLGGWEARAKELERRLADLGSLVRAVEEPKLDFITGRVIADAGGPFARSVLLNAGREHGLRAGYPVINGDGLIGRVLETGPRAARLLLLSDLNSRVPVLLGNAGVKGILMGDNNPMPRLAHLPTGTRAGAGDQVVTSGVGGLFPRGLRIGVVVETPAGPRVALHARLDDLEHVSVLLYHSPALELMRDDRQAQPGGGGERRSLAGQPDASEPAPTKP